MIVLDRDVLVGLGNGDSAVIDCLQEYRSAEWTLPSIVAWESYRAEPSRSEMLREQNDLRSNFDRILDFDDDAALEAAYLDEKLRNQDVSLDVADLLNVAIAHDEGATFLTRNENDFDRAPVHQLVDIDIVPTE
jgi:predicted nucleic acid-binding protein